MKRDKESSKQRRKPSRRVFRWLVNEAAFIDKIVVSADSAPKKDFEDELFEVVSKGIFHPGSLYSRCASGRCPVSGNLVDVVYGRTRKFPNVPKCRAIFHSEHTPLTGAQVSRVLRLLTPLSSPARVSALELTFDVSGTNTSYIQRHLIHRARGHVRVVGSGKRKTVYVGSVRSAWQTRIYQKRDDVTRLEFILRRPFLSRNGINQLEDVLLLRKVRVWDLLSIRRFSASSAARVTRTWNNSPAKQIVRTWGPYGRALGALPPILRSNGVPPNRVLRRTRLQQRLAKMQQRFIW